MKSKMVPEFLVNKYTMIRKIFYRRYTEQNRQGDNTEFTYGKGTDYWKFENTTEEVEG